MGSSPARVVSVHVGQPKEYEWLGRTVRSSIFKDTVDGPIEVRGVNAAGDDQADRRQHGGPDKVLYVYAQEDLDWWESELGIPAGFGQNVTTSGLDVTNAVIGQTWRIGTALVQVTEPRTPCWKLGMRMGDKAFPRRFAAARRPGAHTRLLQPGVIRAGDAVTVVQTPAHGVTVDDVNRIYYGDDSDAARLLGVPELAAHWRTWVAHRTVWHLDEEAKRAEEEAKRAASAAREQSSRPERR